MMRLILKEDVVKVGLAGDTVKVAGGYGRNYLIPQGLAMEATASNMKILEQHMMRRTKKLAAIKGESEAMAAEVAKLRLSFTRRAGEDGKLFGSVTASEIGHAVLEKNIRIDRRKVLLDMPLKQLGEHIVKIKLHPEVTAEVTVEIKAEEPEPEAQIVEPAAQEEEKKEESQEETTAG
jgi:large subunit ribosomal protein L9